MSRRLRWPEPDAPAPDPRPIKRNERLGDDRYCASCGFLFWQVADARAHREAEHPEQARYERALLEAQL